jgi:flagella basal body P-ring formation protein FlgA
MKRTKMMSTLSQFRSFGPATAMAVLAVSAASLSVPSLAQTAPTGFTDPETIDRLVMRFTGQPIGAVGGARGPTDRRLRLVACDNQLRADWHGRSRQTLIVSCMKADGWEIYVPLVARGPQAQPQRLIKRGETVSLAIRGRGFAIQQQAEALEDGGEGEWIALRTARSREPVRARVIRPGLAELRMD